jgi:hypothetical protein
MSEILDEYLEHLHEQEVVDELGLGTIASLYTPAMLVMMALQLSKDFLSKASRTCMGLTGKDKSKCILQYKIDATKRFIAGLNSNKTKCRMTSNPAECVQKLNKKIQKSREGLSTLRNQLAVIMK